jgi:hypothetical protein
MTLLVTLCTVELCGYIILRFCYDENSLFVQAKRRLFEGSSGSMAPLSSIAGAEKVCEKYGMNRVCSSYVTL